MEYCLRCSSSNIKELQTKFYKAYICNECGNYDAEEYPCCSSENLVFVRLIIAGGGKQLRKACRNCLGLRSDSYKHSFVTNIDEIKEYLPGHREAHYANKSKDLQEIKEAGLKIIEDKKQNKDRTYDHYIMYSPVWQAKRKLCLIRDNYLCQGCRENPAVDIHHLTYEHLYNEFLFELVSLCRDCHNKWHLKFNTKSNEAA